MKAGLWTQLRGTFDELRARIEENFRKLDRSTVVEDYANGALSVNGVTFPSPTVPSNDANTLDDYAEGTWTPTLLFGGGSTGMTYTTRVGAYTKIGRLVYITARITLSAQGSSTGTATISGLPYVNNTTVSTPIVMHSNNLVAGVTSPPWSAIAPSTSVLSLIKFATGTASNMAETDFTNTSDLIVNGCYFV